MIEDPDDPLMQDAGRRLLRRVDGLLRRLKFRLDAATMHELGELIDDSRKEARWQLGVDFPKLTALVVPRLGRIALVREDTEKEGVKNLAVRLVYDGATPEEAANAIRFAFPQYKSLSDEVMHELPERLKN